MQPQPTRVVVTGATGRMGQRIIALAENNPRVKVVAGVERPGSNTAGRFVAGGKAPVVDNISEVLHNADVVIDFTHADAVVSTARLAASKKVALVIGTTGLKPQALAELRKLSRKIPIVFSPNMSVGVNLLFQLVKQAAQSLAHYDIEIVEAHHNQKKDAPSGTAMKLAEIAADASGRSIRDFVYCRQGFTGARTKKEIGIMSLRAGDIVGDHTVLISSSGERLELTHRAHSRDAFAAGAVDAAVWVRKKSPGFYTMLDVLKK